jgi:L,D-transpeptidase catalytic domain
MMARRAALALAISLAAVIGTIAAVRATAGHGPAPPPTSALSDAVEGVPHPERPAFVVDRPLRLRKGETVSRFASVERDVVARRRPSSSAGAITRLARETPEGTTNLVLVLGETVRAADEWVHVRVPTLPNGQTGWVPRQALGGYEFVHTHLVVDLDRFTAVLFDDGREVFRARVGVGRAEWPTPRGEFYVRDKLSGFGNPFYGPIAYGTSARSAVLTDWPGGGFIGIHGTNEPQLIPGRISHGCIRLRNDDIVRLGRLMPVGTPVTIR